MLSGGELRRLSLAILVASGANVLILDEPTNHLDLESREALEDALRAFDGALLLVSHDRALLDAVGSRTIAIEDGRLHSYPGGWADYLRVRDERRAAAESQAGRARRPAQRPPPRGPGGQARCLEEHEAPHRGARARGRGGGGGARARRGRARRPRLLDDARALGRVDRAARGGQAAGRAALRGARRPGRVARNAANAFL